MYSKGPVNIYQNMGPVQMGRGHKLFLYQYVWDIKFS